MTQNNYDYIIIGAGQFDLTLSFGHPSPKRRGETPRKNKALVFTRAGGNWLWNDLYSNFLQYSWDFLLRLDVLFENFCCLLQHAVSREFCQILLHGLPNVQLEQSFHRHVPSRCNFFKRRQSACGNMNGDRFAVSWANFQVKSFFSFWSCLWHC